MRQYHTPRPGLPRSRVEPGAAGAAGSAGCGSTAPPAAGRCDRSRPGSCRASGGAPVRPSRPVSYTSIPVKVLVTGGAGFIGSHLVDALVDRGDQVLVLDDLSTGEREQVNAAATFQLCDIREPEAAAVAREWRPDVICHHAAQMSVSRSVREPLFDAGVNLFGGLHLLEVAREVGARFLFASTGGALYGDADVLPTPETYPAWPVSPYGVAKLSFEHYLHCYGVQHGLRYVALRYANVYGPRQ